MTDPNNECCDQLAGLPNAKLPYLENENGQEELFYSPSLLASFTHVHVAEIVRWDETVLRQHSQAFEEGVEEHC